MFIEIQSILSDLWRLWADLFAPVPYGSTIFAVVIPLIIAVSIGCYLLAIQKRKNMKREFGEDRLRAEIYKDVLNLG